MFAKYAGEKDGMTIRDVGRLLKGQRLIADPIGWGGAFFECKLFLPPSSLPFISLFFLNFMWK